MVGKGTGLMGSGYVEFASAAEAEKVRECFIVIIMKIILLVI